MLLEHGCGCTGVDGATSAQRILSYRTTNGPLRSLDDVRKAGVQEQFVRQAADFLAFD